MSPSLLCFGGTLPGIAFIFVPSYNKAKRARCASTKTGALTGDTVMQPFYGEHMVNLGELAEAVYMFDGLLNDSAEQAMVDYGFDRLYAQKLIEDFVVLDFGYWAIDELWSIEPVLRLTEAGMELAASFSAEFMDGKQEPIPQNRV